MRSSSNSEGTNAELDGMDDNLGKSLRTVESPPASMPKKTQVKTRFSLHEQFGHDFANRAGEFETVAGTWTGDEHLRMRRMPVDEEMFVGRVGVHAHDCRAQRAVSVGQKFAHDLAHRFSFSRHDLAVDRIRAGGFAFVMSSDLYAFAQIRKAVEVVTWLVFPEVNRATRRIEVLRISLRGKPIEHLAFDRERQIQVGHQRLDPTARCQ